MRQEVRANVTFTFQADAEMTRGEIIRAVLAELPTVNLLVDTEPLDLVDVELTGVLEEAEIYNPEAVE